jgi:hypothetical protein
MSQDTGDRRRHPRMRVALPARVVAGGRVAGADVIDISEGGILVSGPDLPDGDRVQVEIELAELGWHALDAEVVRRDEAGRGDDRVAARFARVATEGGREAIRAFFEARMGAGALHIR